MKRVLLALAIVAGTAPAASAQSNLLEQGKSLLGSPVGQAVQGLAIPGAQPAAARSGVIPSGLSDGEIGAGLREALKVGVKHTVTRLGATDGYLKDSNVRIGLPGPLGQAQGLLGALSQTGLMDDVETRLNRAAEAAAPKAADIFINAITNMSLTDAQSILTGPKDAATQFFRRETSGALTAAMRPVIENSLNQVGAFNAYNAATANLRNSPLGNALNLDLTSYVVEKALDGLFFYLAREEASIRENPAQRSTDLLKKVFGG